MSVTGSNFMTFCACSGRPPCSHELCTGAGEGSETAKAYLDQLMNPPSRVAESWTAVAEAVGRKLLVTPQPYTRAIMMFEPFERAYR